MKLEVSVVVRFSFDPVDSVTEFQLDIGCLQARSG